MLTRGRYRITAWDYAASVGYEESDVASFDVSDAELAFQAWEQMLLADAEGRKPATPEVPALCEFPWEVCWSDPTHTFTAQTHKGIRYVVDLCDEHLREELSHPGTDRTLTVTPIGKA